MVISLNLLLMNFEDKSRIIILGLLHVFFLLVGIFFPTTSIIMVFLLFLLIVKIFFHVGRGTYLLLLRCLFVVIELIYYNERKCRSTSSARNWK